MCTMNMHKEMINDEIAFSLILNTKKIIMNVNNFFLLILTFISCLEVFLTTS